MKSSKTFNSLFYTIPFIAFLTLLVVIYMVFIVNNSSLDLAVLKYILPHINDSNTAVMLFFTTLGNYEIVLSGNIILFLILAFYKKEYWLALKLASVAIGSLLLMYSLKFLFARPRPDTPLIDPAVGFSFPSGHSLNSMVFYGILIYICSLYIRNRTFKIFMICLLSITIFLIGFSRIYINVHYPTDVIAGFSIGVIWLFVCLRLMERRY